MGACRHGPVHPRRTGGLWRAARATARDYLAVTPHQASTDQPGPCSWTCSDLQTLCRRTSERSRRMAPLRRRGEGRRL